MTEGQDMENIRQTAIVLEDMLRVVTGDLQSYPYQPKKTIPKNQVSLSAAGSELGKRAGSL